MFFLPTPNLTRNNSPKNCPKCSLAALGPFFYQAPILVKRSCTLKSPSQHPKKKKKKKTPNYNQPPLHWRRQRITASCEDVKIPTVDCDQDLQYTSVRHRTQKKMSFKRWVSPHTKKNRKPTHSTGRFFLTKKKI